METKKRILLVDDEASICDFFSVCFEDAGYEAEIAHNGKEALECAHSHKPDAVILDLLMPVMDGITFLEVFRKEQDYKNIPVIVVTGCHKLDTMRRLPIHCFFEKPVEFKTLLVEIEHSLGQNS